VSQYLVGTLIGAAITIVGFGVSAVRDARTRREERDERRHTELGQAMREFLAAVDAIMVETEGQPVRPRLTRADRWLG
jgi:hypothetical protein